MMQTLLHRCYNRSFQASPAPGPSIKTAQYLTYLPCCAGSPRFCRIGACNICDLLHGGACGCYVCEFLHARAQVGLLPHWRYFKV